MTGASLFFKCENFQKMGAFKMRGATNAVLHLTKDEMKYGVATHSSGNFAQALALSARNAGIPAYIVMPSNAPVVKKLAVTGYGGKVIECEPTQKAREEKLEQVVGETLATFIHPYNDYRVIEGQATCAYELIREVSGLDLLIAPVGGGGLISGTALSVHYFSNGAKTWAGEPDGANDAWLSIMEGKIIPQTHPQTIADGLRTSLGDKTFPIIQKHVEKIVCVTEPGIVEAMRLIWERMKIIVEPSSAVALAAILKSRDELKGKRIGIILSGGNVELSNLPF